MPVLMLQALSIECGATRRTAKQKAPRHHVSRSPDHIADALKAEHRIKNIERNGRHREGGVGRARSNKRSDCTRLTDSLLKNLAVDRLAIAVQRLGIDRGITLAIRRINAGHFEERVHAKSACLIRHDRDNVLPHRLVSQELG